MKVEVEKSAEEANRHNYMMLDRLRSDCLYFLGNGGGNEKHLWALSVEGQIAEMKKQWDLIVEKPEWISLEEIESLGTQMLMLKKQNQK